MKNSFKKKIRLILLPFSVIYGTITSLRNLLFKMKVLNSKKVEAFVISVGNLSAGGTGKTPHVNYLAAYLKDRHKVAILLRGYGRQSKGYILVGENATATTVGDEAMVYKKHFGKKLQIAVSESRVEGAKKLLSSNTKPEVIVLDDAYQHQYIVRDLNVLLIDYNIPYWKDFVLPAGNLREFAIGKNRADVIIVTKCPKNLSENTKENFRTKINPSDKQNLFFSKIVYGGIFPFRKAKFDLPEVIILVTGIANPKPLLERCRKISKVKHIEFNDHYDYNVKDIKRIHQIFDKFAEENKVILTTEKDYARLKNVGLFKHTFDYPWFYQCMDVEIEEDEKLKKIIDERIKSV